MSHKSAHKLGWMRRPRLINVWYPTEFFIFSIFIWVTFTSWLLLSFSISEQVSAGTGEHQDKVAFLDLSHRNLLWLQPKCVTGDRGQLWKLIRPDKRWYLSKHAPLDSAPRPPFVMQLLTFDQTAACLKSIGRRLAFRGIQYRYLNRSLLILFFYTVPARHCMMNTCRLWFSFNTESPLKTLEVVFFFAS